MNNLLRAIIIDLLNQLKPEDIKKLKTYLGIAHFGIILHKVLIGEEKIDRLGQVLTKLGNILQSPSPPHSNTPSISHNSQGSNSAPHSGQ